MISKPVDPLPPCCRLTPDGLSLAVRVTPNAGADRIDGLIERDDGTVVVALRVRAVPDKGRANKAVIALVAQALGVPKGTVRVAAGATSRTKTLAVSGAPAGIAAAFAALLRK